MKEIKQWLQNKWNFFKGKKRNIGILLLLVLRGISLFVPDILAEDKEEFIRLLIDFILLGGAADNIARSKSTKQFINNQSHKIKSNLIKMKGTKK